tara:strand:+ start:792 stop:2939 length:2148 start_codon:yes stop_codon:yes gene_type:complete
MIKTLFFIFSFLFLNFSTYSYDIQYEPKVPDKINVNLSWKKLKIYLDHINELKENPKSPISNKYKNFFPSKVYFQNIKNNVKILPASSRITGDWQDHIDFKKNISSLKIKLKESNIGNVVRFRLLLPSSRNINEEIFISTLFETLGYPSLYRKKVQVSINGIVHDDMIFEESPSKEFLERNGYRESPVIEYDERQFWFKLNKLAETCSDNYSSTVATKEFTKCYDNLAKQFAKEFQTVGNWKVDNATFLKNDISNRIGLEAIFFEKKSNLIKKFDKLSSQLGLDHSILDHNRKFIFDPIYKILIPFYYDGNVSEDNLKEYCNKNLNNTTNQYYKNFEKNKNKLVSIYKKRSKEDLNKIMNCVANIVLRDKENYFEKKNIFDVGFLYSKYSLIKDQNPYTKKIYFNRELINFQICDLSKNCSNLSTEQLSKIISGNYQGQIIANNIFFPEIIFDPSFKNQKIKLLNLNNVNEDLLVKKRETVYLNITESTKKLNLLFEDYTSKAVIFNSNLENISISLKFLETINNINSGIRYDKNLLTGCLSIIDSNLKNLSIYSDGANCEDAVNLIRSKGDIEKVLIKNSASDAIDLDFSNVKIKKVIIENSKNDCIDFSGGKNTLVDVNLDGCGDKGISFGEKTLTEVNKFVSKKSDIDFSVKDDSEVKILNFSSDKNIDQTCIRVENKKQEFGSGKLIINNIQNKCKIITDDEAIIFQNAKN